MSSSVKRWTSYRPILDSIEGQTTKWRGKQSEVMKKMFTVSFYAYLPRCSVSNVTPKKYIITVMDQRGMAVTLTNDSYEVKPEVGDDLACFVSVVPDRRYGQSCKIVPTSTQVWDEDDDETKDGEDPDPGFGPLFRILNLQMPRAKLEVKKLFETYGLAANTILNTFQTAAAFLEWEKTGVRKEAKRVVFKTKKSTKEPRDEREVALNEVWARWYDMLNVQNHVDELKSHLRLSDTDESLHVLQNILLVNPVLSRKILDIIKEDPFSLHDVLPRSYPLRVCVDLASRIDMDESHPYHIIRKMAGVLREEEEIGNCFATYEFVLSVMRGLSRETALKILNGEWNPPEDYPGPLTIIVPTRISKMENQESEEDVSKATTTRIIGDVRETFMVDRSGREARIYRRVTWKAQQAYLQFLTKTMKRPVDEVEDSLVEGLLSTFEEDEGLTLTEEQRSVVFAAARHPLLAVIGDAGSGKTTTLKAVLQVLRGLRLREKDMGDVGKNLICLAPTGKAARVFTTKTGWPASTIDSFLCRVGGGLGMEEEVLSSFRPILVIDEMSMVTLRHTKCIAALEDLVRKSRSEKVDPSTPFIDRIVFVGDGSQLSPIGPGDVFHDTIQIIKESEGYEEGTNGGSVITLKGCQRVDESSYAIYHNARKIRSDRVRRGVEDTERRDPFVKIDQGEFKQVEGVFEIRETPRIKEEVMKHVWSALRKEKDEKARRFPTHMYSLQLMTDTNAKRKEINEWVQDVVQTDRHSDAFIRLGRDERAYLYDKVMVCDNAQQFGVVNGDIGWVVDMPRSDTVRIMLEDNRQVLLKTDTVRLTLAYCITVHKSQGSEFPFVICTLFRRHRHTTRTLLYTALSRGQKRVKVIATPKVFGECINIQDRERESDAFRLYFDDTKDSTEGSAKDE